MHHKADFQVTSYCMYLQDKVLLFKFYISIGTHQKADFLFVHSATEESVAYSHGKNGFITKLVNVCEDELNDKHLEDVLLIVKDTVAAIKYRCDGKDYKQMPSVVSQMRDKVWFDKD